MRRLVATVLASALAAAGSHAAAPTERTFFHKDWQLACDNTGACRAAGYEREDERDGNAVSVVFTREAGPGTKIAGELQLGDMDDRAPHPGSVHLSIAGKAVGAIDLDGETNHAWLQPRIVAALLEALTGTGAIVFTDDDSHAWTLSGDGASAVLLKMDDLQGRVGTPSAIVRKGAASEAGVPPPVAMPVVHAASVPTMHEPGDDALSLKIIASIAETDDCDLLHDRGPMGQPVDVATPLWHLDGVRVLVTAPCWRGGYNSGDGYWVANAKPPYDPKLVTASGTDFDAKVGITSQEKGRGVADCLGNDTWTWDGHQFVHTQETTSGMCRGVMLGGAWDLPTIVTKVLPAGPETK